MNTNTICRFYQNTKYFFLSLGLTMLSGSACAEELAAVTGATKWMTDLAISVALTVLGLQIMYKLWQVNQGHKELREVVQPILITACIVATPAAVLLIKAAMGKG